MSKSPQLTNWHPASWQGRAATQQPKYADPVALERVVASLSRLPPLVVSWEIEALRARLARAQRGEEFLLQGGDCAESFADCESDNIAKRLKILGAFENVRLTNRLGKRSIWPSAVTPENSK